MRPARPVNRKPLATWRNRSKSLSWPDWYFGSQLGSFTTPLSDLGSNVVSELLGLFEQGAGVIGLFLRLYHGRGDGFSELGEFGPIWTGLDARRDQRVMLSPIWSSWPAMRVCQFVHRLLKFLNNSPWVPSFRVG